MHGPIVSILTGKWGKHVFRSVPLNLYQTDAESGIAYKIRDFQNLPFKMGNSRGLLLGFGDIAPVDAPEWSKWTLERRTLFRKNYPCEERGEAISKSGGGTTTR